MSPGAHQVLDTRHQHNYSVLQGTNMVKALHDHVEIMQDNQIMWWRIPDHNWDYSEQIQRINVNLLPTVDSQVLRVVVRRVSAVR